MIKKIELGSNPLGKMLIHDDDLWVVINGGYSKNNGIIQILDVTKFNADPNDNLIERIRIGGDPTGIYQLND